MNSVHSHEDTTKLVDTVYKNILDKFNPNTRQLIQSGKAYLKSLHAMAEASRSYRESIAKFAREAQFGICGGSSDIGSAMMDTVNVMESIHAHEKQIMKSFYVDFILPLESNIEKDTKLIQNDQKKFLQEHKLRQETYQKALSAVKKDKKKAKGSKTVNSLEKELKHLQVLEDERTKFDQFCHQSLQNAVRQERRRYGFVLDRQCSMAKQYLTFHRESSRHLGDKLESWQDVAKSRDDLMESVEHMLSRNFDQTLTNKMKSSKSFAQFSHSHGDDELKFRSIDTSCVDLTSVIGKDEIENIHRLKTRTKSQYDLSDYNKASKDPENLPRILRPKLRDSVSKTIGKALYTYLGHGDHQLTFYEGDTIQILGEKKKGWQYGENLRTEKYGWFPEAYVEPSKGLSENSSKDNGVDGSDSDDQNYTRYSSNSTDKVKETSHDSFYREESSDSHTSTDGQSTSTFHQELKAKVHSFMTLPANTNRKPPPPPPLPPPMKSNINVPKFKKPQNNIPNRLLTVIPKIDSSLHSSNDSGFGNDVHSGPPALPEADYSDEDEFQALPQIPFSTPPDPSCEPPAGKRPITRGSSFILSRNLMRRRSDAHLSLSQRKPLKQESISHITEQKKKKSRKPVGRSKSLLVTVSKFWKKESEYSTIDDLEKPKTRFLKSKLMGKKEDNLSVVSEAEPVREEEVENVNLPRIQWPLSTPYHPKNVYDRSKALDVVSEEERTATFQSHYRPNAPCRPRCLSESDIADTDALLLLLESPGSRKSYDNDFAPICSVPGPPDIFNYGSDLEKRLRSPDRGYTLERVSISSGKLYGPWYDLWGQDNSVLLAV